MSSPLLARIGTDVISKVLFSEECQATNKVQKPSNTKKCRVMILIITGSKQFIVVNYNLM
jgi:hypothetical protein